MTYEQASRAMKSLEDLIVHDNIEYKTLIAPLDNSDLKQFIADYRINDFDDKSCIKYSSDGSFDIFSFYSNGIDVLYRKITK